MWILGGLINFSYHISLKKPNALSILVLAVSSWADCSQACELIEVINAAVSRETLYVLNVFIV